MRSVLRGPHYFDKRFKLPPTFVAQQPPRNRGTTTVVLAQQVAQSWRLEPQQNALLES